MIAPPTAVPTHLPAGCHMRGVYLEDDAPAGMVVVRVYDSAGRRRARAEIAIEDFDGATLAYFDAWLDMKDPPAGLLRLLG